MYDVGIIYAYVDTANIRGINGGELKIFTESSDGSIFFLKGGTAQFINFTVKDCNLEVNGKCSIVATMGGSARPKDFDAASLFSAPYVQARKSTRNVADYKNVIVFDNSNVKLNCSSGKTPVILQNGRVELFRCSIVSPENARFDNTYFVDENDNPITEALVIESESTPVGIDKVKTETVSGKSKGIYTIDGIRMNVSEDALPAGLYVKDGKKIIKK